MALTTPIVPGQESEDSNLFAQVRALLIELETDLEPAYLSGPDGDRLELPVSLHTVLRQAAEALAKGQAVNVVTEENELTTQQAADLLNVSRPYLVRLLEAGALPFRKVGTHRRIAIDALLHYRDQESARRRQVIRQMAREAEEMGAYEA